MAVREAARDGEPAFGEDALEQTMRFGQQHVELHADGARRLTKEQHAAIVAPERTDLVSHPAERLALVLEAEVSGGQRLA